MSEKKKILIISGAAPCVIDDIFDALKLIELIGRGESVDYCAVGLDAAEKYKWPIKYIVTYHPYEIEETAERRAKMGGNTDYMVISHKPHIQQDTGKDLVNIIIPYEPPSGSSALLGVLAGIQLGYEKIIVCGCPLIGKNEKDYDYANFRDGWSKKLDVIKEKTRSMSGWTRELLGAPSEPWLSET